MEVIEAHLLEMVSAARESIEFVDGRLSKGDGFEKTLMMTS